MATIHRDVATPNGEMTFYDGDGYASAFRDYFDCGETTDNEIVESEITLESVGHRNIDGTVTWRPAP